MKNAPVKPIQFKPEQIQDIQQAVFSLAETHLDEKYFLVDTVFEKEMGYWYLRLYVDLKEGSISISECEAISRSLDTLIEALPSLTDAAYFLEVSSPGLFRPIKTEREFAFYQGEPVRITGTPDIKNKKKAAKTLVSDLPTVAEGTLQGYDVAKQALSLKDPKTGKLFEVCLDPSQSVYLNPVIRFPEEEDLTASTESDTL
ncbi:ribosome maturation factor RimP [Vampirovibrio sp.]|uniref:ribosome maturation factor RimP n=1 Tax=Vampirovibrio sp. TaxID=2717857 RepID=UPI003594887F